MTDEDMVESARNMANAMIIILNDRELEVEDSVAVISAAFCEALAQLLDPVDAIERLRLTADILERQFLNGRLN